MYGPNVTIFLMYRSHDMRHRYSVGLRWSTGPPGIGASHKPKEGPCKWKGMPQLQPNSSQRHCFDDCLSYPRLELQLK